MCDVLSININFVLLSSITISTISITCINSSMMCLQFCMVTRFIMNKVTLFMGAIIKYALEILKSPYLSMTVLVS